MQFYIFTIAIEEAIDDENIKILHCFYFTRFPDFTNYEKNYAGFVCSSLDRILLLLSKQIF